MDWRFWIRCTNTSLDFIWSGLPIYFNFLTLPLGLMFSKKPHSSGWLLTKMKKLHRWKLITIHSLKDSVIQELESHRRSKKWYEILRHTIKYEQIKSHINYVKMFFFVEMYHSHKYQIILDSAYIIVPTFNWKHTIFFDAR